MLQKIRDNAQSWIAWVIVGLIIIPFALFGLNQYMGGGGDLPVATVDGAEISKRELDNAYYQQRQRLQSMFGGELPANLFSEPVMKQQILQKMVTDELLLQKSADLRMRISPAQIAFEVQNIDAFHEDGKFSAQKYQQVLKRQGYSASYFESQLAREKMLQQFRDSVQQSEFSTPSERQQYLQLQLQTRDVGYGEIGIELFADKVTVEPEEIDDYYDKNKNSYQEAEKVSVSYLEIEQAKMAQAITIDDSTIAERYESQKMNYRMPEERRASHILYAIDDNSDDATSLQKAETAIANIKAGTAFAEIAAQESADSGSAEQGGDLGFFGKGVMDPAFEESVFSLQVGEISEPIKSEFGYHVITLHEIRGGETKPLDEVRDQIRSELQNEQADQRYYDLLERLNTLTYEHPDSLDIAAEELQLPIQTTTLFTRDSGEGIAANPKVRTAAFSEDVLLVGNNSESVELSKNHVVVLRIKQHNPQRIKGLDEVRDEVIVTLKKEKQQQLAQEQAETLLTQISDGTTANSAFAAANLTWKELQAVDRKSTALDATLRKELFAMPHPKDGVATKKIVQLSNGNRVVALLLAVNTPDIAALDDAQKQQADNVTKALSGHGLSMIETALRDSAVIEINQ